MPIIRRPSSADVDRALREVEKLWRPPDKKENAGGQAGAIETDKNNPENTRRQLELQVAALPEALRSPPR